MITYVRLFELPAAIIVKIFGPFAHLFMMAYVLMCMLAYTKGAYYYWPLAIYMTLVYGQSKRFNDYKAGGALGVPIYYLSSLIEALIGIGMFIYVIASFIKMHNMQNFGPFLMFIQIICHHIAYFGRHSHKYD